MDVGRTIQEARAGWSADRVARGDRAAVYAVATAHRLGRTDLAAVRLAATLEDDSDPVVRLARRFDEATYPVPAPMTADEALVAIDGWSFDPAIVAAFRAVQPLIQPVGMA